MTITRTRYICLVTDRKGVTDMIDVGSLDDVPACWIECRVIRVESV